MTNNEFLALKKGDVIAPRHNPTMPFTVTRKASSQGRVSLAYPGPVVRKGRAVNPSEWIKL